MKKSKIVLLILILFTTLFSIIPNVLPQKGTYQFHGAADDQKILKVRTVNDASLEDMYGVNWTDVIEIFGEGASEIDAQYKSVVTFINFDNTIDFSVWGVGIVDVTTYLTDNWLWTTESFAATPDSADVVVSSFYDPTELTALINAVWGLDVTVHNAALYFGQLPTPVAQYLGTIVWDDKWEAVENTVVHNADAGDFIFGTLYQYFEDCTETWTYGETYGAWIGYKLEDNSNNIIYEFSIELPSSAAIPGFELQVVFGVTTLVMIGLIFIVMKKKRN